MLNLFVAHPMIQALNSTNWQPEFLSAAKKLEEKGQQFQLGKDKWNAAAIAVTAADDARTAASKATTAAKMATCRWLVPFLVARVEFLEWTREPFMPSTICWLVQRQRCARCCARIKPLPRCEDFQPQSDASWFFVRAICGTPRWGRPIR